MEDAGPWNSRLCSWSRLYPAPGWTRTPTKTTTGTRIRLQRPHMVSTEGRVMENKLQSWERQISSQHIWNADFSISTLTSEHCHLLFKHIELCWKFWETFSKTPYTTTVISKQELGVATYKKTQQYLWHERNSWSNKLTLPKAPKVFSQSCQLSSTVLLVRNYEYSLHW